MWSARRPGVATTTWGWLDSSKAWLTMSVDKHSERLSVVNRIQHWLRSVRNPVRSNALWLPSYPFHQQWCNPSALEASPGRETARRSDRPVPCMTSHARPRQFSIETPQLLPNFLITKEAPMFYCQITSSIGRGNDHNLLAIFGFYLLLGSAVNSTDLVGVRTRQKIPYGSSESFCSTGSTKAAVFPLPVLAQPIQSRPKRTDIPSYSWYNSLPELNLSVFTDALACQLFTKY